MRILDISGRLVYTNENIYQNIETKIIPAGLYFVQLLQDSSVLGTSKLILND